MDAQIGQVYWAWFEMTATGVAELEGPTVSIPSEVTGPGGQALAQSGDVFAIAGDGGHLLLESHAGLCDVELLGEARPRPSKAALAFLDSIDTSVLLDAAQLEPRYVQKDISWKKLSEQGKKA
jgi:tRNA A37 threonylcarbamoyladenosine modification protein TsaB